MFLHIGENIAIQKKDIVAIIDKKTVDNSKDNKLFIENMIKNGLLRNKNEQDIKSYIITCDRKNRTYNKNYTVYTSNISSTTLSNRKEVSTKKIDWRETNGR